MNNAINTSKLLVIASAIYLFLISICFIFFDFLYILLLPLVLVVLWAAFFKLDFLVLLVVASTPLSINLEDLEIGGVSMYLPTEPLLAGVLVLFIFKLISSKSIDQRIFYHPISIVIYLSLAWTALTCITSTDPIVSVKFLLVRMWFIASMYFIAAHIFKDLSRVKAYLLLYIFPLLGVVIYTIYRHSTHGFDKETSHWVMEPFYKDHTSYGAVLAMYFPIIIGMLIRKHLNLLLRVLLAIGFVILTVGLILSYTRAAWISIIGASIILILMILKIKFRTLLLTIFAAGIVIFASWDSIQSSLGGNKQQSSDKLEEHVGSISNVSSDASNLERLNRWDCAIAMFLEKPIFGWGPGTYQFEYAPFQRAKNLTIISTNQGDGGNAHSEYLGPLCEQGIIGAFLFIVLLFNVSSISFRLFAKTKDREIKILIASAYLGLLTYFIHGVLNNYLDTDKASVPFWGFIAILVAIDLFHEKSRSNYTLDFKSSMGSFRQDDSN